MKNIKILIIISAKPDATLLLDHLKEDIFEIISKKLIIST